MISILFICTANRFRSPLAALYFAREVVQHGHDNEICVSSAGTWVTPGLPATSDAIKIAKTRQLNLSFHRSQPISPEILDNADLILVMESGHREAITHEFPDIELHIHLFSEAAGFAPFDIPDPYTNGEPTSIVAGEIINLIDCGYLRIIKLARRLN